MFRTMLSAAALASASLAAAPPTAAQEGGIHAGALEVPVNKSQVVTVDRAIGKALVGNAEIADVLPISERSVYVLGKKMGTTSLTLYSRDNRVLAVMDVAVGPDVDAMRTQFRQLIPGQTIDARISNDAVILSGTVSDPGAADRAAQIAKAYAGDKVINLISVGGSQQVMLEVRFAEVQRNIGEQLGAQGFLGSNKFDGVVGGTAGLTPKDTTVITSTPLPDGSSVTTSSTVTTGVLTLGALTDTFGIFRGIFNIAGLDINGLLNTLERKGLSKTLAEPTLLALSGERASFLAGGEFPVPVVQSGGGNGNGGNAITVEFKPFGVSLAFTPTVLGDKVINLVVEPEVSSIDPSASITINGLVVPGLQTRRASTTIELRDGESFAIAGLLRRDFATTIRQLPILGSLPIIGALFRSSTFQKGETELLIVVTPRLVAPLRPEQVVLPTDRVKDPKVLDTLLNGDDYQERKLAPPAAPSAAGAGPQGEPAKDPGYEL